jgi:ribonuclease T1
VASLGRRRTTLSGLVAVVIAVAGWWVAQHGGADDRSPDRSVDGSSSSAPQSPGGMSTVALSSLPPEAATTVRLIDAGGPFPYPDHDGGTFGNYEGLLPDEPSGYYHEYTVETPGSDDRGARRIIQGSDGTLYWTADHYEHFAVIAR